MSGSHICKFLYHKYRNSLVSSFFFYGGIPWLFCRRIDFAAVCRRAIVHSVKKSNLTRRCLRVQTGFRRRCSDFDVQRYSHQRQALCMFLEAWQVILSSRRQVSSVTLSSTIIIRNALNPVIILRFMFPLFHKTDGLEYRRLRNLSRIARSTEISNELLICVVC
jgi:hypothetical protein